MCENHLETLPFWTGPGGATKILGFQSSKGRFNTLIGLFFVVHYGATDTPTSFGGRAETLLWWQGWNTTVSSKQMNNVLHASLFLHLVVDYIYITFSHLADAFIQSDVQRRKQSSYDDDTRGMNFLKKDRFCN